jgi:hypothetical protein
LNNLKEKEKSADKKEKENLIQTKEDDFNEFWELYPIKKSKAKAKLIFMRKNIDQKIIINSLNKLIREHNHKTNK